MKSRALARIRKLIEQGEYEISNHALDEALEDDIHRVDIEAAILTGEIRWIQRGDRRGTRYVIIGMAADLDRRIGVVLRFKSRELCAIITVYEVKGS